MNEKQSVHGCCNSQCGGKGKRTSACCARGHFGGKWEVRCFRLAPAFLARHVGLKQTQSAMDNKNSSVGRTGDGHGLKRGTGGIGRYFSSLAGQSMSTPYMKDEVTASP